MDTSRYQYIFSSRSGTIKRVIEKADLKLFNVKLFRFNSCNVEGR